MVKRQEDKESSTKIPERLIAKFIGKNGTNDLAYGRKYVLKIRVKENKIEIQLNGLVMPQDETIIIYKTEENFLKNWEINTVL